MTRSRIAEAMGVAEPVGVPMEMDVGTGAGAGSAG